MQNNIPEKSFDHLDYAGFWIRFFSVCIDLALFTPLYYGLLHVLGNAHFWIQQVIFIVLAFLIYAGFFSSKLQGTPGMYICRFHICDTHGKRITFSHASLWMVASTIGWAFCFAGIIYMQSHFDIVAIDDLRKSCIEQNVAMEDCVQEMQSLINIPIESFFQICYGSLALALFLSFIWALSIALPKDKAGFNNLICGTRFIKGRG